MLSIAKDNIMLYAITLYNEQVNFTRIFYALQCLECLQELKFSVFYMIFACLFGRFYLFLWYLIAEKLGKSL